MWLTWQNKQKEGVILIYTDSELKKKIYKMIEDF